MLPLKLEGLTLYGLRKISKSDIQGSSQGIFACWAGTHETNKINKYLKKNFFFNSFFMFCACISLQNMQKCIRAIHFCFPFIEGKCLFLTLH
jgi:hypothetical protein